MRYQRGYKIFRIHCLTLWLILCTICFYKRSTPFSEALAFVLCFLDDSLGIANTYENALSCSNFVKATLINLGFVPNVTKSIWIPYQRIIWLGVETDINNNTLSITSSQITSILHKSEFLTNIICISARELSELAGKIISTKFIIRNFTHLKTHTI